MNYCFKYIYSSIAGYRKALPFFLLLFLMANGQICGQVGTLTGTGMSICNLYSFSVCPTQTITPLNYGSQGYACTGTTMPDVSFTTMGSGWRVMKNNWMFSSTVSGQLSGYNSSGVLQVIPFAATNTITPLSYTNAFVQFGINGVATGAPLNQATFSISLVPVVFGSNSYTYCPNTTTNIAIGTTIPSQGGPWTYNWQPGNLVGNPTTVSPTVSTIYTVSAQSSAGCISKATVSVNVICCSVTMTPNISTFDASCNSLTGTVIINSVANGIPNYTITEGSIILASNINLPYTISGVSTGTHTYNINSANGCSSTFTSNIQQSGLPPNLNVTSPVMINCTTTTTLNAISTATLFSWSGPGIISGALTQSPIINQLGNYSVTVAQGVCTNSATISVVSNSNIPTIVITPTLAYVCPGQSVTITVNGANSYLWNSNGGLSNNTGSVVVANPNASSIYTVIGTSNTCTNSAIVTVSVLTVPNLTITPNIAICQAIGASVTLTANGANSYTWSNSSTLSSSTGSVVIASPNSSTIYTVTGVTGSCTNTSVVTVSVNPSPTITAVTLNNTSCGLSNGSATVTSSGANTYSWSSGVGSSTNTANSLAPGNYTIVAANGACQTSTVISILSSVPLTIMSSTIAPSNCSGNTGSIQVNDNLSASSYSWNPNISAGNSATYLTPGSYSLTITNGACSIFTVYTVGSIGGPTGLNMTLKNVLCQGDSGSINVNGVINGASPFQYDFNNSGFSPAASFTNLTVGIYTLTVRDGGGCTYTQTVSIGRTIMHSTIDLITNAPNCESDDGEFIINTITGGTAPYLTSFNNTPFTSNMSFELLSSGTYTLNIKDSNLCETGFILLMPESNRDYTFYVPNAFTPNSDKVNDVWYAQGTCLGSFNCLIYNRWGEKIIELNDIKDGWDGTFKGMTVPDGVYVYVVEIQTKSGIVDKTGHITIFR